MNNKIGNWSIRKTASTGVVLSVLLCVVSTVVQAGITTVAPGYEEWRWIVGRNPDSEGWQHGLGRWQDGNQIDMNDSTLTFSRLDEQVAAGGYYFDTHATEGKFALTGYTLDEKGDFNYDGNGGEDGGYPIVDRYDRWKSGYFKVQGKIHVPTSGKWTFCIAANAMTLLRLSLSRNEVNVFDEEIRPGWFDHSLRTITLEEGDYDLTFCQYTDNEKVYYEISAAAGEYTSFSRPTFELITAPQVIYTVTFDSAGGTSVDSQEIVGGRKVAKPADPYLAGHAFQFWTADDPGVGALTPYDFDSAVESNLKLTAVWLANNKPVIQSVSSTPSAVEISGSTADVVLSVDATDADVADTLTYAWSVVGEAPSGYSFSDMHTAAPTVTLMGAGEYVFKVVVSDGHDEVEGSVSVVVTLSKNATAFSYVGCEATTASPGERVLNPSLTDYPWSVFKAAWRSTDTERKSFLLDNTRENAYGLDGYVFLGKCESADSTRVDDVTSGEVFYDGNTYSFAVSNVTPYVAALELASTSRGSYSPSAVCETGNEPTYYYIDDPRLAIAGDVVDFRPSGLSIHLTNEDVFTPFATLRFSNKASRYPKIRIGLLCGARENLKPAYVSVGGAVAAWGGNRQFQNSAAPDWMFFDIDNAKAGESVTLLLKSTDCQFNSAHIHGIIFDAVEKKPGFAIVVR